MKRPRKLTPEQMQAARDKVELQCYKESRMTLKALKKKIGKELWTSGYFRDGWLTAVHGLWVSWKGSVGDQLQGMTVNRTYTSEYCIWPRLHYIDFDGKRYEVDGLETAVRTESVPLADYWRLALSGKEL